MLFFYKNIPKRILQNRIISLFAEKYYQLL